MQLVDGVHHLTFLTEDMDRLLGFYQRVFDAEVTLDMTEEGVRSRDQGRRRHRGAAHEVILRRTGHADSDVLAREHWTTVDLG